MIYYAQQRIHPTAAVTHLCPRGVDPRGHIQLAIQTTLSFVAHGPASRWALRPRAGEMIPQIEINATRVYFNKNVWRCRMGMAHSFVRPARGVRMRPDMLYSRIGRPFCRRVAVATCGASTPGMFRHKRKAYAQYAIGLSDVRGIIRSQDIVIPRAHVPYAPASDMELGLQYPMSESTLQKLGWGFICEQVADFASTAMGKEAAFDLALPETREGTIVSTRTTQVFKS